MKTRAEPGQTIQVLKRPQLHQQVAEGLGTGAGDRGSLSPVFLVLRLL